MRKKIINMLLASVCSAAFSSAVFSGPLRFSGLNYNKDSEKKPYVVSLYTRAQGKHPTHAIVVFEKFETKDTDIPSKRGQKKQSCCQRFFSWLSSCTKTNSSQSQTCEAYDYTKTGLFSIYARFNHRKNEDSDEWASHIKKTYTKSRSWQIQERHYENGIKNLESIAAKGYDLSGEIWHNCATAAVALLEKCNIKDVNNAFSKFGEKTPEELGKVAHLFCYVEN